jgi:hypothetical protein
MRRRHPARVWTGAGTSSTAGSRRNLVDGHLPCQPQRESRVEINQQADAAPNAMGKL